GRKGSDRPLTLTEAFSMVPPVDALSTCTDATGDRPSLAAEASNPTTTAPIRGAFAPGPELHAPASNAAATTVFQRPMLACLLIGSVPGRSRLVTPEVYDGHARGERVPDPRKSPGTSWAMSSRTPEAVRDP